MTPSPLDMRIKSADLFASYVSFSICNGAVIVRQTFSELYPGREIIMLNVDPTGEAGAGIH